MFCSFNTSLLEKGLGVMLIITPVGFFFWGGARNDGMAC